MNSSRPIGILGSGSFGLAVANLLAENNEVLLYTRREEKRNAINDEHWVQGMKMSPRIKATTSIKEVCDACQLIFPIIPSQHFRTAMKAASGYLRPLHIVIHGTKGLDINEEIESKGAYHKIRKRHIHRMSEVIQIETNVLRVGCLSGPNLASEINSGQPTATVVASDYDEVIAMGQAALNSDRFFVFGSHDLIGAEYAGTFKNIIALGSGLLAGKGMGRNMQAMLITRALHEVIYLGQELGSSSRAFLGTAGIGDIIATSFSENSRNFTVGQQFAQGLTLDEIINSMEEVAEGLRTLQIAYYLSKNYKKHTPIIDTVFGIFYRKISIDLAIDRLMRYPYSQDVDFF
jgi:glycerol-3-phosphate dehydrogenase (NAD(P)+)